MDSTSPDEVALRHLYRDMLRHLNARHAAEFADLFAPNGVLITIDGTTVSGRVEIEAQLGEIFNAYDTPVYVQKVREIRILSDEIAILYGCVGLLSPETQSINPALNTMQALVAHKQGAAWRIVHFQNTPARFHGRPDLAAQMTQELERVLPGH